MPSNSQLWPLVWWLVNSWRGALVALLVLILTGAIVSKFIIVEVEDSPPPRHRPADAGIYIDADVIGHPDAYDEDPRGEAAPASAVWPGLAPPHITNPTSQAAGISSPEGGPLVVNTTQLAAAPGYAGVVYDLEGDDLTIRSAYFQGGMAIVGARAELTEVLVGLDADISVALGVRSLSGISGGFFGIGVIGGDLTGGQIGYGALWRRPSVVEPSASTFRFAQRSNFGLAQVLESAARLETRQGTPTMEGWSLLNPDQSPEVVPFGGMGDAAILDLAATGIMTKSEVVSFFSGPLVPCLFLVGPHAVGSDYTVEFDSLMIR